jgi:hypothetical protein
MSSVYKTPCIMKLGHATEKFSIQLLQCVGLISHPVDFVLSRQHAYDAWTATHAQEAGPHVTVRPFYRRLNCRQAKQIWQPRYVSRHLSQTFLFTRLTLWRAAPSVTMPRIEILRGVQERKTPLYILIRRCRCLFQGCKFFKKNLGNISIT